MCTVLAVPDIHRVLLGKASCKPNGLVARSRAELDVSGVLSDGIADGRPRFSRHDDVAVLRGGSRQKGGEVTHWNRFEAYRLALVYPSSR